MNDTTKHTSQKTLSGFHDITHLNPSGSSENTRGFRPNCPKWFWSTTPVSLDDSQQFTESFTSSHFRTGFSRTSLTDHTLFSLRSLWNLYFHLYPLDSHFLSLFGRSHMLEYMFLFERVVRNIWFWCTQRALLYILPLTIFFQGFPISSTSNRGCRDALRKIRSQSVCCCRIGRFGRITVNHQTVRLDQSEIGASL